MKTLRDITMDELLLEPGDRGTVVIEDSVLYDPDLSLGMIQKHLARVYNMWQSIAIARHLRLEVEESMVDRSYFVRWRPATPDEPLGGMSNPFEHQHVGVALSAADDGGYVTVKVGGHNVELFHDFKTATFTDGTHTITAEALYRLQLKQLATLATPILKPGDIVGTIGSGA